MGRRTMYVIKSLCEDDGENYANVICMLHNKVSAISRFKFIYRKSLQELKNEYDLEDDDIDTSINISENTNPATGYAYINCEDRYIYKNFELFEMATNCFYNQFYEDRYQESITH